MNILVTGGAGYIGSHTCVELLESGHQVVVIDNLSNSDEEALVRVQKITGKTLKFYKGDVNDYSLLKTIFTENKIDAVIHFAGYKAVGESVMKPLEYYQNNIGSTITLCQAMREAGVKSIIFSSSATVYGSPKKVPVKEDFPLSATNPYGRTKLFIEQILMDISKADSEWTVILLRYFNPIGAHKSGLIGDSPRGIPNNLMPYITQVATGRLEKLRVFGNDYPTHDGTGVRDYIHVVDLAKGHVAALKKAFAGGTHIYNLGTGVGYSVLDVVKAFEKASGVKIPYEITDRRPGDIAEVYADPTKAYEELGWKAELGIEDMCADSWRWQSLNPNGYSK
ncbi:UDP-glucose 4-epimerase [[Clostridium] cellulosi]|jgi:UDP-galactose 4-epimerase (EC 5.1.3.2)|uniref:UDP-glucose 4-epimerase n=1 Tax=[Clostridium] cellulosi TaxID=29343 RepID=A0A078KM90_9FIRM|nr:MAG: UDP-glucose 4-epimerase GalE [[Clostridium] cellulosi]CDZ23583.1 UDP-glucose 4-epimerase [[Clostridium] cellulosi]